MENIEIARVFDQMADLLEIDGANPFRVRAYRNAARTVEAETTALRKRVEGGEDLTELPAIGKDMARYIAELVRHGRLQELEDLASRVPRTLVDMMELPGVGPKKARKLFEELGVKTVDQLEKAAKAGKIAELEGFGEKTQKKILDGIEQYRKHQARTRISDADLLVEPLLEYLRQSKKLKRVEVAGSYRRRRETVGDLDLLAITDEPVPVIERFTKFPEVADVEMAGDTRATVVLKSGLQVDLRVLPGKSYGAALLYFTGSKAHNIKLRKRAVERDLRMSEYGVFTADKKKKVDERDPWAGKMVAGKSEEECYATVDLPWIPPELREDRGEVEAAEKGKLPKLIEREDLRGDLQMHSTWSDGKSSIEEMLEGCVARGYEYFALTDHSKALAMTGGLDAERLGKQWKEIDEVTAGRDDIRLLKSMEIDILVDGSLDLEDEMIEQMDLVLVSIHSYFDLAAAKQTARIIKAISHPKVNILAHPTGRIINRREPMQFDLDEVLEAAKENGVAVECNAHPERLDLKDTHLMRAKELGVPVVISTDSHRVAELDLIRYGVDQARRGWLTKGDVWNTLPLSKLLKKLAK